MTPFMTQQNDDAKKMFTTIKLWMRKEDIDKKYLKQLVAIMMTNRETEHKLLKLVVHANLLIQTRKEET